MVLRVSPRRLLREGTTKRASKDIAEQTDALGTTLAANSGFSSMTSTVSTSGLVENLDATLDIFADVVRNPTFPQAEVDKYKTRTLAQLQFQRSNPQFLVQEQFNKAIYGNHPASLVAPPADSIKKLTSKGSRGVSLDLLPSQQRNPRDRWRCDDERPHAEAPEGIWRLAKSRRSGDNYSGR